jgi:hypothetical protein
MSIGTPDGGKADDLEQVLSDLEKIVGKTDEITIRGESGNRAVTTGKTIPISGGPFSGPYVWSGDYAIRQQAVEEVAKADPKNIQEVAASQLSIINSYYQSGLQQS